MSWQVIVKDGSYLCASLLFLLGLRGLTHPLTSRSGNLYAALGVFIAVVATLIQQGMDYTWIAGGIVLGGSIGTAMSVWIPMTKMPERIALSHAFGGLAVALVGVAEYYTKAGHLARFEMGPLGFEVLMGSLTFTGSLMAFGKLQGMIPGRPMTFKGLNFINLSVLAVGLALLATLVASPELQPAFYVVVALGLSLGVSLVLPIGGADMPVVICLLNSYAGLAAAASGFAFDNNVLIICGALDGGSGFILAIIMSKAMNRSFANVLFGGFGTEATGLAQVKAGTHVNEGMPEDAAEILKASSSLIVVPGYGMAVSQAQHALRDVANLVEKNGGRVRYAIHPVAGRMPGHMNVLLAEANVPYDQLFDLDQINDDFAQTDAVLVVGANDVVNPAAKTNKSSPIYGMPVFNCDQAKSVIVLKRSMNPGFAGIENDLFIQPNTMMVFGDAKGTLQKIGGAMKEGH